MPATNWPNERKVYRLRREVSDSEQRKTERRLTLDRRRARQRKQWERGA